MVKGEEPTPLPKRTLGGRKYTNAELPKGAQDNGVWRQVFIPTYVQYLASRNGNDTWTISDNDAIQLMQQIWKFVYGAGVPYRIKTKGPVFFLVSFLISMCPPAYNSWHILGKSTCMRMAQRIRLFRTCYR
jgi:hypothetical protein